MLALDESVQNMFSTYIFAVGTIGTSKVGVHFEVFLAGIVGMVSKEPRSFIHFIGRVGFKRKGPESFPVNF